MLIVDHRGRHLLQRGRTVIRRRTDHRNCAILQHPLITASSMAPPYPPECTLGV